MNDPLDSDKTLEPQKGEEHSSSLSPGFTLGQYRIIRLLGRGGMGEVYEAEHTTLELRYALKILPHDFALQPGALERFRREAKVMAQLNHPNIVNVDEFGETEGRYWLRMELVEGIRSAELGTRSEKKKVYATDKGRPATDKCIVSLQDYAESRGGKIPQEELLEILKQILEGLSYAHSRGAIHRDLKPSNILLSGEEGTADERRFTPIVKISDFGLVRLVGEEWVRSQAQVSVQRSLSMGARETMRGKDEGTSTRALLGTYEYMSPEQKRGEEADERSDIYSLGLMTFKLLTGRDPGTKPPSRIDAELMSGWDDLVAGALEPEKDERVTSCGLFAEMLDGVEEQIAEATRKRRAEQEQQRKEKEAEARRLAEAAGAKKSEAGRKRGVKWLAGIIAATAVLFVGYQLFEFGSTVNPTPTQPESTPQPYLPRPSEEPGSLTMPAQKQEERPVVVPTVPAEHPVALAAPAAVDLTGTVSVTKDDDGLITAAELKVSESESVAIKLDYNGKRLARTAPEGKAVKVTGTVTEADGKKTIAIQKFSEAESVSSAIQQEERPLVVLAAPAAVDLTGTVSVIKDESGLIIAAELKVNDSESVAIKLDYNGKRLARTAPEGKAVKVTGIVTEADGKKTIAVQKFSEVEVDLVGIGALSSMNMSEPQMAVQVPPVSWSPHTTTYVIREDDSLSTIAYRYNLNTSDIMALNATIHPNRLIIGQRLLLPGKIDLNAPRPLPILKKPLSVSEGDVYVVKSGDSLSIIADRHGTTTDVIKKANGLSADHLGVGQKLIIPDFGAKDVSPPIPAAPTKESPGDWPFLTLNGVVGRGAAGSAMINGGIVAVGEKIEGVKLLSVRSQGIILEYEGETKYLKVGESIQ